ncbi:hypothetical protein J1605_003137 [Eschrichtius robustus]|uniref:Uncharacterized protein n=1 Tax=Eschrichtius robustus TaxID=9764 RepID=A0AB34HTS9_ESCRO|nr:hypothetical protein J1605_003137 [Eschrichtius robustus]
MRKEVSTERHQEGSRSSDHPLHVSDSDNPSHRDGDESQALPRTTIPESRGTSLFRGAQVWGHLAGVPRRCARVRWPRGSAPVFPVRRPVSRSRPRGCELARRAGGGGMGLSRVRAVFFDLDNTLIDTAGASRKGMLEVTFRLPLPSGEPGAPPRALSRPLGPPAHCPVGSLRAGAPGPGGPSCRPAAAAPLRERGGCDLRALPALGLPEGCRQTATRAESPPHRKAAARQAPGFLPGQVWTCRDERAPGSPGLTAGGWSPTACSSLDL